MITRDDIAKLKEIAKAATQIKWKAEFTPRIGGQMVYANTVVVDDIPYERRNGTSCLFFPPTRNITNEFKANCAHIATFHPAKVLELLDALAKTHETLMEIADTKDKTLLGRCCVNDACFKFDIHGCAAQITAHNAFYQNAERAIETLQSVFGESK